MGEVAQLLEEPALQQPATAVIELDGNLQIFSCRRIYGLILVPVLRRHAGISSPGDGTCPAVVPETKEWQCGSVFLFFFLLHYHLPLRQAGSEVMFGNFLMH